MEYYTNDKKIIIPDDKKTFGQGSEGKVYKIKNELYKIYYDNMLNENYGNKRGFHGYLLGLNTKQIILPESLIFDKDCKYVGYKTKLVNGKQKDRTGIIKMSSDKFIKNLKVLTDEVNLLTNNFVLMADVTPFNYIYNQNQETMNIIDPGRYRIQNDITKCKISNDAQLEHLIKLLIYLDLCKYKPIGPKKKELELNEKIQEETKKIYCLDYFEEKLKNYETPEEYFKELGKYIK